MIQQIEFVVIHCAKCSMPFAVTADYQNRRRDDHRSFACPEGHNNYFAAKSEAEQLRDQLAAARRREEYAHTRSADLRETVEHLRRSRDGTKGRLVQVQRALEACSATGE